jgi:hypothetical protein
MVKTILASVLSIATIISIAGPFNVQAADPASPIGCNADRSVVNIARSTASASVGETITFTVEAGNPVSVVDDGCDIKNRTMTVTLPNGDTETFGPFDYPYPVPLAIVGSVDYVASAADLIGGSWTATVSWTGIQKDGFDSVSTGSKGTSVVYVPILLEVKKTASTTFDRTITWGIDKRVDIAEHNLSPGVSGVSAYTITLDKSIVDSNYAVTGTITINNPASVPATITGVTDVIEGLGNATVDCPVTFPYLLAPSVDLVCTYSSSLPDTMNRTNTVTVTTSGDVEGDTGEAIVSFGGVEPTIIGFDEVTITDTNSEFNGPRKTDADVEYGYDITFVCNADEGENPNTATIVETEQRDDATVIVNCANPAINIEKATNGEDADTPTGPMITVGNQVNWTYVVKNTGDVPLTDILVTDDQGVIVSCPKTTLAVGESMICNANGVAVAGQYSNLGLVTGSYGEIGVNDTDPSHYFGEQMVGEWCSPGYWRQSQHLDSWSATGYSPSNLFLASFPDYVLPTAKKNPKFAPKLNPTLMDILSAPQIYGGEAFNMVGELLSSAHPDVNFIGEREGNCPLN